jgi:hypothetical protein
MTAQRKVLLDDVGSTVLREIASQLNSARSHATCGPISCANAGASTLLPLFYADEDSYLFDVKFYARTALANVATDIAIALVDDGDMSGAGIAAADRIKQVQEFNANGLTVDDLASMDLETEMDGTAIGTTWTGALPARIPQGSLVVLEVISTEIGAVNIGATATYAPIKDELVLSGGGVSATSAKILSTRDR